MKKPEPWPTMKLRPPRGLRGWSLLPSGRPKRRKNCSRPGGRSRLLKPMVREPPSTLTRTEMTEGFTFSTMSAKPTGRCADWACAEVVKDGAGEEHGRADAGNGGEKRQAPGSQNPARPGSGSDAGHAKVSVYANGIRHGKDGGSRLTARCRPD